MTKQNIFNILNSVDDLTECSKQIFQLPHGAQVENNLTSMGNYFSLIKPMLDSMDINNLCEIGADSGFTSAALAEYAGERDAHLHIVDPVAPVSWNDRFPDNVTIHRLTSLAYLEKAPEVDVYFLDGDHNHYTVSNELQLIQKNKQKDESVLIFLHDVSWPWAYRDMYYDKSNIPNPKDTLGNTLIFPTEEKPTNIGCPISFDLVEQEGGQNNGVKSAIEQFLLDNADWNYFDIPSLFGLGVLWSNQGMSESNIQTIAETRLLFSKARPFLSILELNRITLLAKVRQLGDEGTQLQKAVDAVIKDKQVSDDYALELEQRISEYKEYVAELEGRLSK